MGKKNKVIKINPHKNLIQYILASVFAITGANLFAQTPTTFTATNVKVMDTLTSNDLIRASEIVATETITAKDDIVAEQDVKITGALTVTNTATFKGIVDLGNGIGFKSIPATSSHPTVFKFGTSISLLPPSNGLDPEDLVACANPILGANPLYSFVGSLKASSYLPNSTGSTILGHDGANGILDVQGTASNNGVGGLLVNVLQPCAVFCLVQVTHLSANTQKMVARLLLAEGGDTQMRHVDVSAVSGNIFVL